MFACFHIQATSLVDAYADAQRRELKMQHMYVSAGRVAIMQSYH